MTAEAVVLQVVTEWTRTAVLRIVGFGLLAGVVAMGAAILYRRTTAQAFPLGAGIVTGSAVVAAWVSYTAIESGAVIATTPLLRHTTGYYLGGVLLVSVGTAAVGREIGDRVACVVYDIERLSTNDEAAALLRAGERVVELETPDAIGDLEGYAAVEDERKRRLADRTLLFPRTLSREAIESRLERRIEEDIGVDHADATVESDGTVSSLAVGHEPAGLGPSLAPNEVAVGIRASTAPSVGAGDPVEIWDTDGGALVTTGTVKSTAGKTATVVVDHDAAEHLESDRTYRITTRPARASDTEAFLSVLRDLPETVSALSVDKGGRLEGEFVSWLPMRVLLIVRDDEVIAFPEQRETLQAGDTVYVVGTPAAFDTLDGFEQYRQAAAD